MPEPHHCHAFNCTRSVPPKMLMCARHWKMCPPEVQRLIWRTYVPGQEITKTPTRAYLLAQRGAVWTVFAAEGGCKWPDVPEVGSDAYMIGPACLKGKPDA